MLFTLQYIIYFKYSKNVFTMKYTLCTVQYSENLFTVQCNLLNLLYCILSHLFSLVMWEEQRNETFD